MVKNAFWGTVLASLIGIFIGMVVLSALEGASGSITDFAPPATLTAEERITAFFEQGPWQGIAWQLAGYALSAATGGYAAVRLAPRRRTRPAYVVALVMGAGGVANFVMLTHPVWFIVASLALIVAGALGAGLLAHRLHAPSGEDWDVK